MISRGRGISVFIHSCITATTPGAAMAGTSELSLPRNGEEEAVRPAYLTPLARVVLLGTVRSRSRSGWPLVRRLGYTLARRGRSYESDAERLRGDRHLSALRR